MKFNGEKAPGSKSGAGIVGIPRLIIWIMAVFGAQFVSPANLPAQLVLTNVGTGNTSGYEQGVAIVGARAYVANNFDGLLVYNISNPSTPLIVSQTTVSDGGPALGIAVSGSD